MTKEAQQQIISQYIDAYNSFNVPGMLRDLHPDIKFENVSNGEVTLTTTGIDALKSQAEAATAYFSSRRQTVTSWQFEKNIVRVEIAYAAILAQDFPNGMKLGDRLDLTGQSEFEFSGEKIVRITDRS